MSKKERVKTNIDILKALLLALLSAIFAIFAYCVINYKNIDIIQGISIALGIIFLALALFFIVKKMLKNLDFLEEFQ